MSILAHTATRTFRCGESFRRRGRPRGPAVDRSKAEPTPALKGLRDKWQRSGAFHGGSIESAGAIPDADWQAGVTPFNWRYKVTLDGEPLVGAVAARESTDEAEGWVVVQLFGNLLDSERVAGTERRKGLVRVVPGDRD